MKTSLDHLPLHKREQLAAIVAMVCATAPVEMIILFGSYARGNWVEDLVTGYFSDYDLMVIVATEEQARDLSLWAGVTERARLIGGRIPVTFVAHHIKEINQEIRVGQYFFSDVVTEGVLLYDSRRFNLAKPRAQTPGERLEIARRNFNYWFQSANEFWRGAGYYAARNLGPHAAFSLHQAAERYFHAVLLVYTGYKPKTHDIEALAKQTATLHPALEGALPRTEPDDERLFDLLKRAYIEARYSKSYRVTAEELAGMSDRVLDLARRALRACTDKLATICGNGIVGLLPEVPSANDAFALPSLPELNDAKAVEAWSEAIVRLSYERGESIGLTKGHEEGLREGRHEGLREGEARGRHEGLREGRAQAIVDVLNRRGLALTELQSTRILVCRDEATLAHWWDLAWSVSSVDELWD